MSTLTILILIGLIVFITHSLEAITGFGCTVLAFPFVIAIMGDIGEAKILLSVLAWLLALYFVITKFKDINWKQFFIIISIAGVGLPIGIFVFKSFDSAILSKLLGVFIIISSGIQIYKLFLSKMISATAPTSFSKFKYAYLFLGGIVHGAFATGGPLIVLYSTGKLINKGEFRSTMCLIWATLNSILMVQYFYDGKFTDYIVSDILLMLPFLGAGVIVGEIVHKRVNEMLFKKIVFITLFLVGLIMTII